MTMTELRHTFPRTTNLLKRFFSLSIKTKFILSFISVIIIISISVVSVTLYTSMNIIENRTREISLQLVNQIADNVEYKVKDITNLFNYISSDTRIRMLLENKNSTPEQMLQIQKDIKKAMEGMAFSNSYIKYVCIQSVDKHFYWWESPDGYSKNGRLNEAFVKQIFNSYDYKLNLTDEAMIWLRSYNSAEVLTMGRVLDSTNGDQLGSIVFGIDSSWMRSIGKNESIIKEENIAVLDQHNNIITYGILNNPEIIDLSENTEILNTSSNRFNLNFRGVKYIVSKVETARLKWRVLCFIPVSELISGSNALKLLLLVICAISLLVGVVIAYAISANITKNINRLEKNMQLVEDGNLNVRVKPASYDEIGRLGLRFNYMINQINTLINTVYKERIAKQQAEYQVLQAQIHPHFLYNTLGSIKWLARMKEQKDIEDMTTSLIELLKVSINKKNEFQTISEEIKYIKNYILLQKIRYENRFDVEYQIDSNVEEDYILNFILQPLVENALYHGIEMSKSNALITIKAYREENFTKLEVEDNGVGMTEEMVRTILLENSKKVYHGLNSIGVKIVNERIKLHFGDAYGLRFTSTKGVGTRVEITVPQIREISEVENVERNDRG